MMERVFIVFFAVLLLFSLAFAPSHPERVGQTVSSQDALGFVSQNGFLFSGETTEISPSVQVLHASEKYWIVSVLPGDSSGLFLPVFLPVAAYGKVTVPQKDSVKRALVETGFVLRNYQLLKDNMIKQDKWLFSSVNTQFLGQLAVDLADEKFSLETVKSELSEYPGIQDDVDSVKEKLDDLRLFVLSSQEKLDSAIKLEQDFFLKPDTNSTGKLREAMLAASSEISFSDKSRAAYFSDLEKVKQAVAQTSLSLDTKRSLQNLLSAPQRTQRLSALASYSAVFSVELQGVFDSASSQKSNLVSALDTRVARSRAFLAMYSGNNNLIEKTNGDYSSLSEAVSSIFSPELEGLWKEQSELSVLKEDWRKAESYYSSVNYSLAEQFAKKAENSVLRIYSAGFIEQEQDPSTNFSLLLNGIIVLVVLLIVVYVLRNRKKLFSLVSSPLEEQEYE